MHEHIVSMLEVVLVRPLIMGIVGCKGLADSTESSRGLAGIFHSSILALPSRMLISISCSSILSF